MDAFSPSLFTILIVDDTPKNLQVLGNALVTQGYNLEFATSGQKALDWLEIKKFDLILLDIMMPEMSGFEVCQIIRTIPKHIHLPIIFLTAVTEKESLYKGFELGGQDYITKPFDMNELFARVKNHLELKHFREQLEIMNDNLEVQVAQRTQQLSEANHLLAASNAELLKLDERKTEFLQIISHEMRTPLNGIIGSLSLMQDDVDPEDLPLFLELMETSVRRLERFSLIALRITELRTGQHAPDLALNDLFQIVYEVVSTSQKHFDSKKIQISLNFPEKPYPVYCEKELIASTLESILDNSLKHTPEKGNLLIFIEENNDFFTLNIKDSGPGFSDKASAQLFKLFTLGDVQSDQHEGLDLALAKLVIEAHHGKITAYNHPEGGACVSLKFPAQLVTVF